MTRCKKTDVISYLDSLPEDTSIEEVMEKIYFLGKVQKGLQQKENGEVISHEDAVESLQKWMK